jgi:thiol-disulfide isomerase/thioredoxin
LYYSGEDINDIYGGSNLHLMYIFYHKDQLDNIMNSYVRELAATFRAHYAFIMIDSEKYSDQTRQHMIEKSDLPIIVLKRPNKYDSSGIQIRQEHISYKFETLSHLMVNVILPDGLSPQDEDEGERDNEGNLIDNMPISFLDIKSLNDLRRDETPTIFIACERDSIDCTRVEKSMEKAKKAVLKVNPEYELRIFIIEVKDVKELHQYEIEVKSLPKVIVKEDNEFRPYESHMKAADFVKIIINFSKKGKDGKEEDKFVSEEDYYSQFEELKEDEPMGILYPFMLPHYGGHLTNENASQFIQQSKNSLVAFYVPYCIPCRPMLQNVMELNDTLYKMGIDVALVNCAGYPDVCQSFNVTAFPTLLIKRDGSTDNTWNTYDGIVSHEDLLNSLTGQNNSPSNIELTPTSLMTMFRSSSDNMKSLVVYFDHELSDGKADLFTRISVNQIYWLNSTRYSHVANKLAGSNPLPLLMLIDYDNRHVYHMAIGDTAGVDEVKTFISDVLGGKRPADVTLDKATWTPFKPAVKFPSEAYTRQHGRGDSKNDIKENDNIRADSPLTSSSLPNSHSSHEEL